MKGYYNWYHGDDSNNLLDRAAMRKVDGLLVRPIQLTSNIVSGTVRTMVKLRRAKVTDQKPEYKWHKRLGHVLQETVKQLLIDLQYGTNTERRRTSCQVHMQTKQTKALANRDLVE